VPIGLRNIMSEWLALGRKWVDAFSVLVGVLLLGMGLRAVVAVGGLLA
jgi:fumarate reductase subunit C